MSEKISVDDAINEYYNLKNKYETNYQDTYIKPILKAKDKSKREKRVEYSKLPKAECVNCKRNVGTIFSIKNKDFTRIFSVKCGDLNAPCPLNINIVSSTYFTYETEITSQEKEIDNLKMEIIKEKYDIMFGYTDEETGINNFIRSSNILKDSTELLGGIIEKNILTNDNPEKHELLKKTTDIFGSEYILQFKQMIKQYHETGNTQILNEAVKFYLNEMLPRVKEIEGLKYENNFVEYNLDNGEYKLFQRKNSLQNLEYALDTNTKVVSFVKGLKASAPQSKSSTLKVGKVSSKKSKTKKLLSFVIEGEEPNAEPSGYAPNSPAYAPNSPAYAPNSPVSGPNSPSDQIYKRSGNTVIWDDSQYNDIWIHFSDKYKDVLLQDLQWMEDTVKTLADMSPGTSKEFVLPSNIVLPPKVSSTNELDFGNAALNDLAVRLTATQKGILIGSIPKKENLTEEDLKPMVSILKPMLGALVDFV
jgi:hypothetical protein